MATLLVARWRGPSRRARCAVGRSAGGSARARGAGRWCRDHRRRTAPAAAARGPLDLGDRPGAVAASDRRAVLARARTTWCRSATPTPASSGCSRLAASCCAGEAPPGEAPSDFVAESAAAKALLRQAAPGRADLDAGAADRRDRHRQGDRRAPHSPVVGAARAHLRADQLRGDPQRADGGRAVRLRAGRVLRRGARLRRAADGRPRAAPSSSTRSTTPRWRCRRSCCACSRTASSRGWARTSGTRSTSAMVAATNRDLKRLIGRGAASARTCYERLSTVQIDLPPLRERLEDLARAGAAARRALLRGGAAGGEAGGG